ncbi:IspD/TarI family cytidylyltransferase, partial [Klebsiella pneumoniae]|uniref:IspD/TarI family cytidylyltransferase n=1 Tax=Klebsiella pneumoniae TaxID=573 RepID=UPI00190F6491
PQMFRLGVLLRALQTHQATGFAGITDEASAVQALGLAPRLVRGRTHNIKLNYPEDVAVAQALLPEAEPAPWRVGEGW